MENELRGRRTQEMIRRGRGEGVDKYCDRKELMENQRGGEEVGRRRSNNKGVGKGEGGGRGRLRMLPPHTRWKRRRKSTTAGSSRQEQGGVISRKSLTFQSLSEGCRNEQKKLIVNRFQKALITSNSLFTYLLVVSCAKMRGA